jgi:hypothetical protein
MRHTLAARAPARLCGPREQPLPEQSTRLRSTTPAVRALGVEAPALSREEGPPTHTAPAGAFAPRVLRHRGPNHDSRSGAAPSRAGANAKGVGAGPCRSGKPVAQSPSPAWAARPSPRNAGSAQRANESRARRPPGIRAGKPSVAVVSQQPDVERRQCHPLGPLDLLALVPGHHHHARAVPVARRRERQSRPVAQKHRGHHLPRYDRTSPGYTPDVDPPCSSSRFFLMSEARASNGSRECPLTPGIAGLVATYSPADRDQRMRNSPTGAVWSATVTTLPDTEHRRACVTRLGRQHRRVVPLPRVGRSLPKTGTGGRARRRAGPPSLERAGFYASALAPPRVAARRRGRAFVARGLVVRLVEAVRALALAPPPLSARIFSLSSAITAFCFSARVAICAGLSIRSS